MTRRAGRVVGALHADDVSARNRAAHLRDGGERVVDFEFIRQPPRIFLGERHVVLDEQQVWDVERKEAERFFAVQQLAVARGDEILQRSFRRENGNGRREKSRDEKSDSHFRLSPACHTS